MHRWTKDKLEALPPYLPAQTSLERKRALYTRLIAFFEAAKEWERAIDRCAELAGQYDYKSPTIVHISTCNYMEARN
jgi:lipopolysaccharide biosynthesis regulator YciM